MTLELLEDMESPNTPGKIWRKGQLVDVNETYGQTLIDGGKAQIWTPPPPDTKEKEAPKKRKK